MKTKQINYVTPSINTRLGDVETLNTDMNSVKTKLNGIESGAQKNQTIQQISEGIGVSSDSNTGLLSSTDYMLLMSSIAGMTLSRSSDKITITHTDHSGAEEDDDIPGATVSLAGVMTSADKTALNGAIKSASVSSDESTVSINLTPISGTASTQTIPAATSLKAGVITASDRIGLSLKTYGYSVNFVSSRSDDAIIKVPVFNGQKLVLYVDSTDMTASEILQFLEKFVMTIGDTEYKTDLVTSGNYATIDIPVDSITGFKIRKNTTRFYFNVKLFII